MRRSSKVILVNLSGSSGFKSGFRSFAPAILEVLGQGTLSCQSRYYKSDNSVKSGHTQRSHTALVEIHICMASSNLKTSIKYMGNRRGEQVIGSRGMDGRGQWRGRGRGERRPDGVLVRTSPLKFVQLTVDVSSDFLNIFTAFTVLCPPLVRFCIMRRSLTVGIVA